MANYRLDRLVAENNQFFFATVVSSDAATYVVQVAPISSNIPGLMSGIVLSSAMAGMMGVKECSLPQPCSTVFCFKQDAFTCLILGVVPDSEKADIPQTFHARSSLGAGDSKTCGNNIEGYGINASLAKLGAVNANRPTDVVDGEYVLANEFGILLGLYQHFSVLKASELAQVQAFLYDDLVRIVSHNFEHFTCMGGSKTYQSGKDLNLEFGLTHDAVEASGRPAVGGNELPTVMELTGKVTVDDEENFFKLTNERQSSIERLRGFVGALGDFVHLIFSKPADGELRAVDGKPVTTFDRGLASLKMGMDGTLAVRTLGGFALEKTNWVRVPHRIKVAEEKETSDKKPTAPASFKFDSTTTDKNQPLLHFLQLRDYLAFTMEGQDYRKFTGTDKFTVNDSPGKETPIGEDTQLTDTQSGNFYPKSSGVYAMPNGGLVFRDAWGSAIVMEGGNVYIQPAKDLVFQPARNLVAKVGQNISLAAKKEIDVSSTTGGFRLKTDLAQYLYSESSGIILHSDAASPSEFFPKDELVRNVGGILLHAPKAGLVTNASHSLFKTDNNTVLKSGLCMIDASDRVLLRSDNGFDVFTTGDLLLSAGKNLIGYTEGSAIFVGLQATALGIEKQTIATGLMGPVQGLFEEKAFDDWKNKTNELSKSDFQEFSFGYKDAASFEELQFRFPTSASYRLAERIDAIPQTIAQQEDAKFGMHGFGTWEETAVNETYPYPGAELTNMYAISSLANLEFDQQTQQTYNKAAEHTAIGQVNFTELFKEYKVYA